MLWNGSKSVSDEWNIFRKATGEVTANNGRWMDIAIRNSNDGISDQPKLWVAIESMDAEYGKQMTAAEKKFP